MRLMLWPGLTALLLAVCGCAGYHLGPTNGQPASARSVQINPFQNQTIEPRLADAVSHALRKQIQQDGTFKLNTRNDGDIIVSGTIVSYDRHAVSFRPRDALSPLDLRVTMRAHVTARERISGKVLFERDVSGHSEVRSGSDLISAERQALPLVAERLAINATALLVDGTW
ncbi:MAG TPA: LptE family protein [Anaerolineales bacterium]|jgi:hypothetical protein